MKFVQQRLLVPVLSFGLLGVLGCGEADEGKTPEGTLPPGAPKSSMDAFKNNQAEVKMPPKGQGPMGKGGNTPAPPAKPQ